MTTAFAFLLAAVSSGAVYVWRRDRIANAEAFLRAVQTVLECVGTATVFLAVNTVTGLGLLLMVRGFSSTFVSLYLLNPPLLIALSLLQGFLFRLSWRE